MHQSTPLHYITAIGDGFCRGSLGQLLLPALAFPSTRRLCSIPENAAFEPQSDGASPGP